MIEQDKNVTDDQEPLDPQLAWLFEGEVLHQWGFATRALAAMNHQLQHPGDMDAFWFAMDAALGALGNLSKIFFPTRSAPRNPSSGASSCGGTSTWRMTHCSAAVCSATPSSTSTSGWTAGTARAPTATWPTDAS
jgi:hypothetical protein